MLMRCVPSSSSFRGLSRSRVKIASPKPPTSPRWTSKSTRPLVVLGIESSADDSCCAIVTSSRQILANVVVKQHAQNARYGGIHPLRAQEAHLAGVPQAIAQALQSSRIGLPDVDAIAYTRGPGMFGCLSVGASAARALAASAGKPLIGVHHMEAHALTPLLTEASPPAFPFLVLLVSGGHTQLVICLELDRYEILMDKLDNSIGGAFDRAAKILSLPPSSSRGSGAVVESFASEPPLPPFDQTPMAKLPIAFHHLSKDESTRPLAFSFAGLISALERSIRGVGQGEAAQREGSRRFQEAAIAHLVLQVGRSIERLSRDTRDGLGGLVVSGGVASNQYLRTQLRNMLSLRSPSIPLYYPPIELCTDNAAMIAWTAILRLQAGKLPPEGESMALPLRAKWSLEDLLIDEARPVDSNTNAQVPT